MCTNYARTILNHDNDTRYGNIDAPISEGGGDWDMRGIMERGGEGGGRLGYEKDH